MAIVDSRPFGGTCALLGRDLKKVLARAAELVDWNRRMEGKSIGAEQARIEWPELMRLKRSIIEAVPKNREESFGVRVELQAAVKGIQRTANGFAVQVSTTGQDRVFHADMVLHGAGRVPEIDDMDLAAGGVEWNERGVKVNEYVPSVSNLSVDGREMRLRVVGRP